jgi:hypothetical protein
MNAMSPPVQTRRLGGAQADDPPVQWPGLGDLPTGIVAAYLPAFAITGGVLLRRRDIL